MNWENAFKIIEPIPTDDYVGERWPHIRYHKMETYFKLASQASGGCIVELGTYRGLGAITLTLAAKEIVYTIDDFKARHDASGVLYGPENEQWVHLNARKAGVRLRLVNLDVRTVGKYWTTPVSLLVWDLGTDTMEGDLSEWYKHITPRGRIAIKEFGSDRIEIPPDFDLDAEFPKATMYTLKRHG